MILVLFYINGFVNILFLIVNFYDWYCDFVKYID